jgi:hypothetical protein
MRHAQHIEVSKAFGSTRHPRLLGNYTSNEETGGVGWFLAQMGTEKCGGKSLLALPCLTATARYEKAMEKRLYLLLTRPDAEFTGPGKPSYQLPAVRFQRL